MSGGQINVFGTVYWIVSCIGGISPYAVWKENNEDWHKNIISHKLSLNSKKPLYDYWNWLLV